MEGQRIIWNLVKYTIGAPVLLCLTALNAVWILYLVLFGIISISNFRWSMVRVEFNEILDLWRPE